MKCSTLIIQILLVSESVRININTLIHVPALDHQETMTHFICGYYGNTSISQIIIAVDSLFILIFCNQGLFFNFAHKRPTFQT